MATDVPSQIETTPIGRKWITHPSRGRIWGILRRVEGSSPARLYAMLIGGALVIGGGAGFFYDSGFDTGSSICASGCDKVAGLLAVNGWHNLVHIATGALGLLALTYGSNAQRVYALGLGAVYILVAILGFIDFGSGDFDDPLLKVIPVNTEDNFLHLILGVLGIGAGWATPRVKTPPKASRRRTAGASTNQT